MAYEASSDWLCNVCENTNVGLTCLKCKVKKEFGERDWVLRSALSKVVPKVIEPEVVEVVVAAVPEVVPVVSAPPVQAPPPAAKALPVHEPSPPVLPPVVVHEPSPPVHEVSPPIVVMSEEDSFATLQCRFCKFQFQSIKRLQTHIINKICRPSQNKITANDLSNALLNAGKKQFPCDQCSKSYGSEKVLKNHVMDIHGPGKLTVTLRNLTDNSIKKITMKHSQRLQIAFNAANAEWNNNVANMTFNNITLTPLQFVHGIKIKDGDEILVTEIEYNGEAGPPQKKRKTSETTSAAAVVANNNSGNGNTI